MNGGAAAGRSRAVAMSAGATAALALVVTLAPAPEPLRAAVVGAFLMAAPGAACAAMLGLRDIAATLTMSVGISLALAVLVAQAMLLAHAWHPTAAVRGLAGVTIALSVLAARPVRVWS